MNVVTVVKRGLTPPEGFQQAEGAFSASPRAARGKHPARRAANTGKNGARSGYRAGNFF